MNQTGFNFKSILIMSIVLLVIGISCGFFVIPIFLRKMIKGVSCLRPFYFSSSSILSYLTFNSTFSSGISSK